ncbi:MAG: outer membrane lipoprotein carrier protein LolA [Bacteroidota bacterium]
MSLPRFLRTSLAFAAVLAVTVLPALQAQAQDSDELLDRLRMRYETTDALRAQFTQSFGEMTMQGTLVLRGDAYRIETPDQMLVTDGTTSWVYSKADGQVLVNDAIADETTFSPADFFTNYPERFNVEVGPSETVDGVGHDVLLLTPKSSDTFLREVTLWVRRSDTLPRRVQVVDGNGLRMVFDLRDVEVNPPLRGDVFRFTPPPGAEVVDLRS